VEQGEKAFGRIAGTVSSSDYQNFNFFPQQTEEETNRIRRENQLQGLRDAEAREEDYARHFESSSSSRPHNPQRTAGYLTQQEINRDYDAVNND
jgi:hypothetical protein